jgi:hypothetical protein
MRVLLAAAVLLTSFVSAAAEPPTGFSDFKWGTRPDVIREQLLSKRCREQGESRGVWYSLECHNYSAEGLSLPFLRLDFEPGDSLAGYYMTIARGSYPRFRDLALQRFGPPTSRRTQLFQGTVMSWVSQGVRATLIEKCGVDISCIDVATAVIDRRRQQLQERERRDAVQSF